MSVLERLLLYLDVSSLEWLANSCSFFRQLVYGSCITTLEFPFSRDFIKEVAQSRAIEKKPLLRLRSSKKDDTTVPDDEDVFVEYMVSSQLALLNLTKLRELHLLPALPEVAGEPPSSSRISCLVEFDRIILGQLSQVGCLGRITRLEILVNKHCYLDLYMGELPGLLYLGLTVVMVKAIRSVDHF